MRAGALGACLALCAGACSSDKGRDSNEEPVLPGPTFEDDQGPVFGAGGGSGGTLDPGEACVGQSAGAESEPAVVELVVDTSGSMDQDAPGSRSSKWTVTRQALLEAIAILPPETSLGVTFYPDVPIEAIPGCFDEQADVEIARLDTNGSAQRRQIQRAFQNQSPDGGTPTHDAYRYGLSRLEAAPALGRRFIVVITDGTPTFSLGCEGTGLIRDPVDPAPLVVEAASASTRGVSTFVIGSPGSEGARQSLSRMAEAGGTAAADCSHTGSKYCHFDMTEEPDFGAALGKALGTISGLALSCTYDIPEPPGGATLDPSRVNVLFSPNGTDEELILQSPAGACTDGWQYSADGAQVLLCSSTCERVRSSSGSLSLQFGCSTRVH
jgi:von Willebrand factor type A domain